MNIEDADAARSLLGRQAQHSPPPPLWTAALATRVKHRRRRARVAVTIGVAASMALIAAAGVTWGGGHNNKVNSITAQPVAKPPTPPQSIQVNGKAVPYVGAVPWADPVAVGPNPRDIDIYADGDATHGEICDLPIERVSVAETATSVVVSVAGYQDPLPAGTGCAGTGHQPQLHKIQLRSPLGDRVLIDSSDGARHRVLDESTIPAPHEIPAGLLAQPVQWDESSGFVTRSYTQISGDRVLLAVGLEYGTFSTCQCAVEHSAPNGRIIETITIAGVSAQVWRYTDMYNDMTTLQWTPPGQKTIRLTVSGTPTDHLTIAEAISIARSVR